MYHNTKAIFQHLNIVFLLCLMEVILFSRPCTASDYLWLSPDNQTTLPSGNAACEITLMKNQLPLRPGKINIISAVYRLSPIRGSQKAITLPLTIRQKEGRLSFMVEAPFVSLCEIQLLADYNGTACSLQCIIPLFGNGSGQPPAGETPSAPEKYAPPLLITKENRPYYFPATGEKITFCYQPPFTHHDKLLPFIVQPDGSVKEPEISAISSFSYTYPAAPPFAAVADTSKKRLIIVQPDITPDGKPSCSTLTFFLAEPHWRYMAVREGWLLFFAMAAIMAAIARKIIRRAS